MATKKKQTRPAAKAAGTSKTVAPKKTAKTAPAKVQAKAAASVKASKTVKPTAATRAAKPAAKPTRTPPPKAAPASQKVAPPAPATGKATEPVTAKKTAPAADALDPKPLAPAEPSAKAAAKGKSARTTLDDLALDVDEKDQLLEEEKRDLAKALREEEDEPLETAFVPTDTSERFILVVDEEGQRRTETVSIVQQILPNAVIEVADDPEEALEVMEEADFDTYVVNFLMPGFSASPFVKAVANHPDHPLLIGFAADKISDALDQRKGLKIIPLKRLFDLDVAADAAGKDKAGAED